jgi:hypothetical protein
MKKSKVRSLINHWHTVWYHYRTKKNLLLKDQIIVKFLLPGYTLAWNSLGCRYHSHIADLTVYEQMLDVCPDLDKKFDNILVLNSFELRYSSIEEYASALGNLCNHLSSKGRLVFGVNSIFINWNRTAISTEQMFEQFILIMKNQHQMDLKQKILRPFNTDSLNGDCFLIFDKQI